MSHPLAVPFAFPPADSTPPRPRRAPDGVPGSPPEPAPGVTPDAELPVVSAFPPDPSDGAPLTSRREMFCRVYVACGNAADAARRAGYAEGSARQQGWRLLEDDSIRARIEELWRHAEQVRETDRDLILDAAGHLFESAMAARSFNAAARALVLQAQLAGFTGPARNREPIVPGRPGPVARARQRQAEAAAKAAGPRPPQPKGEERSPAVSGEARPRPCESGVPPLGRRSNPGGEGPGMGAGRRPRDPVQATSRPAAGLRQDPWAEAGRITRERELAGVHSKMAAVRRREALASRPAHAAIETGDRAA